MNELASIKWYAKTFGTRGLSVQDRMWLGVSRELRGYRFVYAPPHPNAQSTGYVAEHRLVVERKANRLLLEREQVHHRNGDGLDNRAENLRVFPSKSAHTRFHHRRRNYLHLARAARRAGKSWDYFFTPELRQVLTPEAAA